MTRPLTISAAVLIRTAGKYLWILSCSFRNEAIRLQNAGVHADSDEGQSFAKAYWDMITDFTGGDMSMLPKLIELGQFEGMDPKWKEKQKLAKDYIGQALESYLSRSGVDLFQEDEE